MLPSTVYHSRNSASVVASQRLFQVLSRLPILKRLQKFLGKPSIQPAVFQEAGLLARW